MAWLVCGTIPDAGLRVGWQTLECDSKQGILKSTDPAFPALPVQRGTPTLCAACALVYPVRDGIPVMLPEEAVRLDKATSRAGQGK